jgi:hypothetical protein
VGGCRTPVGGWPSKKEERMNEDEKKGYARGVKDTFLHMELEDILNWISQNSDDFEVMRALNALTYSFMKRIKENE